MLKSWLLVFSTNILLLSVSSLHSSFATGDITDGTITTSGCLTLNANITNEITSMRDIQMCHYKNFRFQKKDLSAETICAQVITNWKDPESGQIFNFPSPCDTPQFFDASKGNATDSQPSVWTNSSTFTVVQNKSSNSIISINSIQPVDQQAKPVSIFAKGENEYVKVSLSSQSSQTALATVDLVGSDLTSLGVGSIKSDLSQTVSEMTLSFFIPETTGNGTANICIDVFSDWPDKGGIPLARESCEKVLIGSQSFVNGTKNANEIGSLNQEQNTVSACNQGFTYDATYKQCIPIRVAQQSYCKEGYRYDAYLNQCFPIFEASSR